MIFGNDPSDTDGSWTGIPPRYPHFAADGAVDCLDS
jgi:hypothetical protein